jgi:hypothetical protein
MIGNLKAILLIGILFKYEYLQQYNFRHVERWRDAQNHEVNQHENSKEALYPFCGRSYRLFYTLPNDKCFIAFFARGATIFS